MKNRLEPLTLLNRRGFFLGWHWIHQSGDTTKSSACIASYHHPKSITWRWALYWYCKPTPFRIWRHKGGAGVWRMTLRWQKHMFPRN